ncbi:MAG TPA: hypothetical protein EYQ68_06230 [Cytophagales bacterium]|jgi:hypothetical protein|nr:hypothetical protein [Cytophagales bacterium]
MAIIKVTFDEGGLEYEDDPNGKFEIDDTLPHPHRWQVKEGVLIDIFEGLSDNAILAKIGGEADAEIAGKLVTQKSVMKKRVKADTGRLIAATDWKLDRARDTGADNTDILVERQALRDKSNVVEDAIDDCKDEMDIQNFRYEGETLELK